MSSIWASNAELREQLEAVEQARDLALKLSNKPKSIAFPEAVALIHSYLSEEDMRQRLLVGISGFPGSGKTTLAKEMASSLNRETNQIIATHVSMDGFHLSAQRLDDTGLAESKGDPATYDLAGYSRWLDIYKHSCDTKLSAPDYDRVSHDIMPSAIEVPASVRVLVTEGIYVGCCVDSWLGLDGMLDILFYLDATASLCAGRIVERNLAAGRNSLTIERKLANDFRFMLLSLRALSVSDYLIAAGNRLSR